MGGTVGAVTGGLLGLIGGPVGVLAWAVGGAVVGGVAGHYMGRPISKGDLQEIGDALVAFSEGSGASAKRAFTTRSVVLLTM